MRVFLMLAWQNVVQSKRRTYSLGIALSMLSALLDVLMALSTVIRAEFLGVVESVATGHVNVTGFLKTSPSQSAVGLANVDDVIETIEATPGVSRTTHRVVGLGWAISGSSSIRGIVPTGINPRTETQLLERLEPAPPSSYLPAETSVNASAGNFERIEEPETAILFESHARKLNVGVDDVITLRANSVFGRLNTVDVRIVGVARDIGMLTNWTIFVSQNTLIELFELEPDSSGIVLVYLDEVAQSQSILSDLRSRLDDAEYELTPYQPSPYFWKYEDVAQQSWTGYRLDLTTWRDEVSYLSWILEAIDALSFMLLAILLGIVAIGIVNATIMATRERTQEIGTMRAMGMRRTGVLATLLLEASILGLIATSIGGLLGALCALGLDFASLTVPGEALRSILLTEVIHLDVSLSHIAIAVLTLTLFTTLSTIWPAYQASKLQPVTAMQRTP